MRPKAVTRTRFALLVHLLLCVLTANLSGKQNEPSEWRGYDLPFHVLNATAKGSSLWVCGTDENIAVSDDDGQHWHVKHQATVGALLLHIDFANDKFGYAAGTGGIYLTTDDGGETWLPHSAGADTILQLSFADAKHGLIRTPASLLFTTDAGATWSPVSAGQNSEQIKSYPYTFSLVALDPLHMAVMLKQGAAQYESQVILSTADSGKSWRVSAIPSVTLYSFLRAQGKYWTVGTEVIHKDRPGGGYAVPVALYSSDGETWTHSDGDLSACKPRMCVICKAQGCFSDNGTITNFFSGKTEYGEFSPSRDLTPKWAATPSAMCFVGSRFWCTGLKSTLRVKAGDIPLPTLSAAAPLGMPPSPAPRCLFCALDRILIDKHAQGSYPIKLVVEIARNGTVTTVKAEDAPTPEIKSRIEQQAQQWIFEPYQKDGAPVAIKLNTTVRVNVVKPQ